MRPGTTLISLVGALAAACSAPAGTEDADRRALPGLSFVAPAGWVEEEAASDVRAAQFRLPGGDAGGDAELVVYHFGAGGAGGIEANVDRWIGQFEAPGGGSARDAAVVERDERHGLEVHRVEVEGTYVAETRPGSGERVNAPDHALLAAIVETDAGPYYAKLVGPSATVARWSESFAAFLGSLRPAPADGEGGASHP